MILRFQKVCYPPKKEQEGEKKPQKQLQKTEVRNSHADKSFKVQDETHQVYKDTWSKQKYFNDLTPH